MHQRLNTSLNGLFSCFLWIRLFHIGWRSIVQIETQFFHFVFVTHFFLASRTQIEVLYERISKYYVNTFAASIFNNLLFRLIKNKKSLKEYLRHILCNGTAFRHDSYSYCTCIRICLFLGYVIHTTCTMC